MTNWTDLDVEAILERLTARGVDFVVIGGLIGMKPAAGRPKDQADVEELEAIRRLRA